MASNGAKQPLLSGFADPTSPTNNGQAHTKRRLRRVKSAPLADSVPIDIKEECSLPRPESGLGNFHQSIRKVAILLGIYLGIGAMCFYFVRDDIEGKKTSSILDAVYFCVVTMTSVGYGDLVPNSAFAKLLACVFVFSGMALVALILSKAADYIVEKQEILVVKALHMHHKVGPSDILKEIETNRVKYKCILATIILLVLMVTGTIFLYTVEGLDFIDAFYCVCSTMTTLGYGDKSFSTEAGRVFAVLWILISTLALGQFFLCIAEYVTEARQRELISWVLNRRMTNVDLEAADLDDDGVVGAAEFIIYKLKEMGKITQEDVSLIMEEFEDLDFDQSGTISESDLMLSQATNK